MQHDNISTDKTGKIEDILKSIRGIIDNHGYDKNDSLDDEEEEIHEEPLLKQDDVVLELTAEVNSKNINSYLISEEVKKAVQEEIRRLKNANDIVTKTVHNSAQMNKLVSDLILPLIKNWLDTNLPSIVEKIISKEIKNIIHNK